MLGEKQAEQQQPVEIATDHRCMLGDMTDALCDQAASGVRGEHLAEAARAALSIVVSSDHFARCCVPAYLALAPQRFDREIQLPIASADEARLDTRVLLWPIGAADGQHPHCDGWAAFVTVRGALVESEDRDGVRQPEAAVALREPKVLVPEENVSHHIHNVGGEIGLTIHVFGT
jgi:hypothetical protein